jgi:hypothetical protein
MMRIWAARRGKQGRGSENKAAVYHCPLSADESRTSMFAVIEPILKFRRFGRMIDWGYRRLAPEAEVFTDGLWFRQFADDNHAYGAQDCRWPGGHQK